MTFRDWLIKRKLQSKSAIGDLARDVLFDETAASRPNEFAVWREHLKRSPENVLATFDEAWRAYRKAVKRAALTHVVEFQTPEAATAPIERR